jgi:acetylornithine deacetylase/succinyl-diaminopimelate desuccinylase-like protein
MSRRLVPLAFSLLLLTGCGGSGSLSAKDVQKELEAVQSFAAEGALVADGAADDRTTDIFVRVHTQYLGEGTKKVEDKVSAGHASGDVEAKRKTAVALASAVEEQLARLHRSPGDREVARDVSEKLRRYAGGAEKAAK